MNKKPDIANKLSPRAQKSRDHQREKRAPCPELASGSVVSSNIAPAIIKNPICKHRSLFHRDTHARQRRARYDERKKTVTTRERSDRGGLLE